MNVDLERRAAPDLVLDLRGGFPAPPGRVRFVYSEHTLEHLDLDDGRRLLADCRRALEPDGVLRLAMPDVRSIVESYLSDWRSQDWVSWEGHEYIDSAAHMLNVAFHAWGHRYLYDHPELERRLAEAGFSRVSRAEWGESDAPELRGLETRTDSLLIFEARP